MSGKILRFAGRVTRNSKEYSYSKEEGRLVLSGDGVRKRVGLLMNRIGKDTNVHTGSELLSSLQELDGSYSRGDVSHGMKRLVSAGCAIKVKGGWKCSPKGVKLFQSYTKVMF